MALAAATAMFAIYYATLRIIAPYVTDAVHMLPVPIAAPGAWGKVLMHVADSGITDLVAAIVPLWIYLHLRGRRLRDLGLTRSGTPLAWGLVLAVQVALVWFDIAHGPVGIVHDPLNAYALMASAVIGPCAAISEEFFFRGYVMDELQRGGFGPVVQAVVPMLFFGLAHFGYLSTPGGWSIMLFTGLLGGFWSVIYLIGGRSLWPSLVAHTINDAVVIPSAFYLMFHAAGH
jgi:membrane protease YdiL (CAAX protease family)